jgi:hypothetical protein
LRIGEAFGRIRFGKVIEAAFSSDYNSLSGFNSIFKNTKALINLEQRKKLIYITRILTRLSMLQVPLMKEFACWNLLIEE